MPSEPSAVERTGAALRRIERDNDRLLAFSHVAPGSALEEAEAADRGAGDGPLHGEPVGVKDLVAVRGMPLEAGSPTMRGRIADVDAPLVERLRAARAVILGKTSVDEFALTTVGPARSPLDDRRTAGGSSGGSGAAVGAGMCRMAVASDTGGSVRIPAACCGVVGLKTTYGRIPKAGTIGLAPSLDSIGVIAATAADAAAMLGVLAGYDKRDPSSAREPVPDYAPRPIDLGTVRLGVPSSDYLHGAEPDVLAAFAAAQEALRAAGVELNEVELPPPSVVRGIHWAVLAAETAALHRTEYPDQIDAYGEPLRNAIAVGSEIPAHEYLAARHARERLTRVVDDALARCDALVLPTMPIGPPLVGQREVEVWGRTEEIVAAMVSLTSTFNHSGHPALALPAGQDERRLPFSVQLVGPHHAEAALLTLGAALEPLSSSLPKAGGTHLSRVPPVGGEAAAG